MLFSVKDDHGWRLLLNFSFLVRRCMLLAYRGRNTAGCWWRDVCIQDIADIYEKEEDYGKAMEYYDKAAELYSGENVESTSNQCKLKVAQYAAQTEQYVVQFHPVYWCLSSLFEFKVHRFYSFLQTYGCDIRYGFFLPFIRIYMSLRSARHKMEMRPFVAFPYFSSLLKRCQEIQLRLVVKLYFDRYTPNESVECFTV